MDDKFTFNSAGQVHELELALDRVGGWNAAIVKKMCEGDRLRHIREYVLGVAKITYLDHTVDCDADPFIPNDGWKVEKHQRGGCFEWDAAKVKLFLTDSQEKGRAIESNKLREELAEKAVLNACVLDFLLANPRFIPEEWKDKDVFFWGTIYRYSDGGLYVRYLCWRGVGWDWGSHRLGHGFCWCNGPAAVRAS